jgi:hypothetical protein
MHSLETKVARSKPARQLLYALTGTTLDGAGRQLGASR